MKNILKNRKSRIFSFVIVSVSMIFAGIFIQSCSNDEDDISDEISEIQSTGEYAEYIQVMDSFKDEVFKALNSMSIADRSFFLENLNNDEVMIAFLEKYNLSSINIRLQESAYQFKNKTSFNSLNRYEKEKLFRASPLSIDGKYTTIPRLKSGNEIGEDPCYTAMINAITIENSIVTIEMLGCTCMVEVPIAACLCYIAIMARHYERLAEIEEEYQECLNN